MKTIEMDARRYAWCRGHALWIMGGPVRSLIEDLEGALRARQDGLVRYCARAVGEACAVALNLILHYGRPIPSPTMRGSWALECLAEHGLRQECWELIRGVDDEPSEVIVERCSQLVSQVREMVGELPNILTPEGYFPALSLARDWLQLMEFVGEEGFLPRDWTRGT
jgi:hypothetical protein